jgi:PKD repeat protein
MKPFLSLCKSLSFFVFITLTLNGCSGAISSRQQSAQTITFNIVPSQVVGATVALSATASSGLPVSFASESPLVCTVNGTVATLATTGTCTIQATQAGNLTYASATPVSQNFAVTSVPLTAQTITFAQPAAQTVGTPLTLTATATSGLAVSFASTTSAVCTVSGTTATFLIAGTCTIQATQAGNSTYAAATMVARSFAVNAAALTAQTITFNAIPAQTAGTALTLTATASSKLPVSYTSTTGSICTITGPATVTLNAAGTCTLNANQAGNSTYAAAPQVSRTFTVNAATPKPQTITFGHIASQTAGTTLVLTATASSGLAVSYTASPSSVCTISGASSVTLSAAGTCAVQASQAGNSFYLAATPVSQSITVTAEQPTTVAITSFTASSYTVALGSQVTLSWVVTGATSLVINQQVGTVTGTSVNVTPLATGANVYTLTANSANGPVMKSLTINVTSSSAPTISSFTASAPTVMAGTPVTLTWAVTGATSLSISSGVGTVTGTSTTVTPAAAGTFTYTLTATNSSGSSTSSVVVVVTSTLQPPVVSLSAVSSSITLQGAVTLNWTESGATSLSIDQGVGTVPVTSNSINTTPTASGPITYTITATNAAGSTTSSVTVNVIAAQAAPTATPPYPRISAAGTGYTVGSPITLNFSALGATSLSIDQGVGIVTGTSTTVTPTSAGLNTYTLTASNRAGSASAFVTVYVAPATPVLTVPTINNFTTANTAIAQGSPVTLTWSVTGATSLSIDSGVGTVTGQSVNVTPANSGSNTYTLTATNATGSATAQVTVVTSATAPTPQPTQIADCTPAGMSPICVPFLGEKNTGQNPPGTVFYQPWGAGGEAWPQQLFWQDVPFNSQHLNDMLQDADGIASNGALPLGGNVAWGYDLLNANGGWGVFNDFSKDGGYMQYAAWMDPREGTYFALGPAGTISYPDQGYVSFSMPMLADDLPSSSAPETFGKWAGESLGNMAVAMHLRGYYDADFFIGVYIPDDYHPRLINSFESWAGVTVPGATVQSRADYIGKNLNSEWIDFVNAGQVSFLAGVGNTLLANGVSPVSGGQLSYEPTYARATGSDPRAWETQLPGKNWIFLVENESQGDRSTPSDWTASYSIGASASRVPDVPVGVDMDGFCGDSVLQAALYNKHLWLSAGWTYIANLDGSVRRASQVFQRNNWDAQTACADQVAVMRAHIPTHPFGPAFYYSDNVARYFESPNNETNYYYFYPYLQRGIATLTASSPQPQYYQVAQGINLGYWISDAVDPSTLKPVDIPSAWLLYDSNRLPADELAKLQALAPVYDLLNAGGSGTLLGATAALAAGPVHATGAGLNMLAFVDQNGSVILMVTNQDATDQNAGALVFNDVSNGSFNLIGLLGTPSTAMTVVNNTATVPISVTAYDTVVYEIPALKWMGH